MKYLIAAIVIFGILFFARSRRVVEELEAHLDSRDPRYPAWRGKCERKTYGDGYRFRLRLHLPGAAQGERVAVRVNDNAVGELRILEGRGRLDLESTDADGIPQVREGDSLVVELGGQTILLGSFRAD